MEETRIVVASLLEDLEVDACREDPKALLARMKCWDEREGVEFPFQMLDAEAPWGWQSRAVDLIAGRSRERLWYKAPGSESNRTIWLKARQIGVTWIGVALGLHTALYQPGSLVLFYRQKHSDAEDLVRRAWYQLQSLPPHLWNGAAVLKPQKGALPSDEIRLEFAGGRVSRLLAQSSADSSGHGSTAAFVLLDEFARIDNAPEIMKAVSSVAGRSGKVMIISTANGHSTDEGGGNYFHYLWQNADEQGLLKDFLGWRLHPDRDDEWFATSPEVLNLRPWERAEQYPDNPEEAFALSSAHFFDSGALDFYTKHLREPLFRGEFEETSVGRARFMRKDSGMLSVYEEPEGDHSYAIGADTSTGRGLDYSSATVVDLVTMGIVAEFHGKLDVDQYALQLHYLGKWYHDALLAVEDAGGFGDAVIVGLRDGREGRPFYPRLYQHKQPLRGDLREHKKFGYPMNHATRPQALGHLEEVLRERALPFLTEGLLSEMRTFCRFNPSKPDAGGTWPRAWPDGLHDDRVMSAAIALDLYRQYGQHPDHVRHRERTGRRGYRPAGYWPSQKRVKVAA